MLKKVVSFILVALAFVPALSFAAEKEYKTLNLAGALAEEGIESKLKNYKESDDKATVYLFRGKGCGFCRGFLTYLNDHIDELGKYFNLVSYEVWYDADNAELMKKVGEFTGVAAEGVPYIVVGERVFAGFTEDSYGEEFSKTVKELYESKDRYDVFAAMDKAAKDAEKEAKKAASGNTPTIVLWNGVFSLVTICAVGCMLYYNNKSIKKAIESRVKVKSYVQKEEKAKDKEVEVENKPVKKKVKKTKK